MPEQNQPKTYTKEDILMMWPQAKGELLDFQHALQRKSDITATRLGMALQLADEEFKRLSAPPTSGKLNVKLRYAGRSQPIPEDDPFTDDQEEGYR